jgi:AraC family transcriptional regulator
LNPAHDAHSYYQRFDRVAAYIEAHLDQQVDLNILAEVAHFSPYHFHRIYHALSKETVGQTVKRLRLHRAAGYLVQTNLSIAEIAKCTGYPNVQSFTRIFKSEFGSPPALYRKTGSHTRFLPPLEPSSLLSLEKNIEVEILHVEPMFGMCAEHRGSYLNIKRAFDPLFRWATARGILDQVRGVVGIYLDDPFGVPEKQLRSLACLMFEQEIPHKIPNKIPQEPPFTRAEVLGGPCAVLRHQGPYADMRLAYQWLYGTWLPRSSREVADQPVFEVYLNHPRDTRPADLLVDIYLPLQEV